MICIYKDERITILKCKSRIKDKTGSKSRYLATIHNKPISKDIKFIIQPKDIPKLIADHTANFIVMQNNSNYSIYYNGSNYHKMKDCKENRYLDFLNTYNLHEIYTTKEGYQTKHYLK